MSDPVVLRIRRPYADENEFLVAEAWTIEDRSIVLVDQPELPQDTVVRFEIILEDGSKPIRAEGKVSRLVPPTGEHPGGLKVRFRRFDPATKRFIERAVAERQSQRRSRRPPPAEPLILDEPTQPQPEAQPSDAEASSSPEATSAPDVTSAPLSSAEPLVTEPVSQVLQAAVPASPGLPTEVSGIRSRVVPAPPNREELLERLRERAKRVAAAKLGD